MKKIKVGFVGAGWMGSVHLKRLSERNNAEILALCETNRERGENILKELKLPQGILTDSYDDILKDKSIVGDAIGMGIIHAISSIVFLMKSQSEPVSVYAKAMPSQVRGFEPEPVWTIIINFKNGATGTCLGNIDYGNGYDAYHNIFGTKGGFIFDSQQDNRAKVRYWAENTTDKHWIFPMDVQRCREEGFEELAWPNDMSMPDSGDVIEHQTGAAVDHFLNCIEKGELSPLSFANSRIIGEIGWAAQMSALTGIEISLPLDREEALRILKYAPGAGRDSIPGRNGIPSGDSIPGRNGSRGDIGGDV